MNPARGGVEGQRQPRTGGRCARGGFTLIEVIVTLGIVVLLLSIVLPMLSRTVAASRGFKCQQSLRSVAFDFTIFADDALHGPRGRDAQGRAFTLTSFQDSQYCINDFWCWPGETRHDAPDAAGNDPMRCPSVGGSIVLRSNVPCNAGGVSPYQNVSYGFNIRLLYRERLTPSPAPIPYRLTQDILSRPQVPLVWDVDGAEAVARGGSPFFTGPSLDSPAIFAGDQFWFPGMRHNGAANFAFIDGHVEASARPLEQPTWQWDPEIGR